MTRGIDVGIVAFVGFVFDVRNVDGDAAGAFFGGIVNLVVGFEGDVGILHRQDFGDGGGEGRLAVIDVPDRPDVHMRFIAFKFSFCHSR